MPTWISYALRPDVHEWLKAVRPVRLPLLGRWINWQGVLWKGYAESPFSISTTKGRLTKVGRGAPPIWFWRRSDALMFKLRWGGL